MTLVFYYAGNLLFQTALTILLISLICQYNPKDHRSVIFQRLMYAGLLWAGFDLIMELTRMLLPPEEGFRLFRILSFMFLVYPPLAIQLLLSLVRRLTLMEKRLILAPYVLLYLSILLFPGWANAVTFGISGGYPGAFPPWNTAFKVFSLGAPILCVIFVLFRSASDSDPVVRKEKQLLAFGAILFMTGIVVSQVAKEMVPGLPWFANFSAGFLGITAFFSLKKYGRVLSGQALFETIVYITPSGICHVRDLKMIWSNPGMKALLNGGETGPEDLREIFSRNQPEGTDREGLLRSISLGTLNSRLAYIDTGHSDPRACLVSSAPLERGRPENGVLVILTDVSEENRIRQELSHLNRRLERMAHTDSLTKIANRRQFDGALEKEWLRSRRHPRPLSLVLMDVDFFKCYNDHYGHPAGDQVLKAVAREIQQCPSRPDDLACRIGGEEFALILPETPLSGAALLADRVRSRIQALEITHDGSDAAGVVTLSAGVACTAEFENLTPGALMRQADRALYQAKEHGRNRCEVFRENIG